MENVNYATPQVISTNNLIPQPVSYQLPQSSQSSQSSTNIYMWVKLIISVVIIGLIIYIIWAFHKSFGEILNDILNDGKTFFQAVNCTLEKLNCCINSCPGSTTPCSASQIASMKDNSGCNICTNCSGGPCYLPSFKNGISCTEWGLIGLFGLLAYLFTKIKRDNTEKIIEKADKPSIEASGADVLDLVDIGKIDNTLDDSDFKDFNIDKSNKDAKAEINKFMKKDPDTLKESDIPKSVKDKFNLEGDALVERCKTRLTQRDKARASMEKHTYTKNLLKLKGPSDKDETERLQKNLTSIENEWKDTKDTKDKSKDNNDNDDNDDYSEGVNEDFHGP